MEDKNSKQSDSPEETDVFYPRAVSLCFSPTVVIRTGDQPSEKIATLASHYGNRLLGLTASLHVAAAISL